MTAFYIFTSVRTSCLTQVLCECLHAMPRWLKLCTHTHARTHTLSETFYPIPTTNLSFIFEQLMNFKFQSCKLSNRKYSCYTQYAAGWTVQGSKFGKYKVVQIWPGLTAACLHTNQSRSYLNHLAQEVLYPLKCPDRVWGPPTLATERVPDFSGVRKTKG